MLREMGLQRLPEPGAGAVQSDPLVALGDSEQPTDFFLLETLDISEHEDR